MKTVKENLVAWIIVVAAVTPFFHFPFWLTVVLTTIGSVIWLLATRLQRADISVIIVIGIMTLAFLVPAPVPITLPAPLHLAFVVSGWSIVIVLSLYLAERFWQK